MNNFKIDDIPQEFQKAWHYANGFMATAIKSEEHCKTFLKTLPVWTEEEKEFLLETWILIKTGEGKLADDLHSFQDYYELEEELENEINLTEE